MDSGKHKQPLEISGARSEAAALATGKGGGIPLQKMSAEVRRRTTQGSRGVVVQDTPMGANKPPTNGSKEVQRRLKQLAREEAKRLQAENEK